MEKQMESGYQIINILILESLFSRKSDIDFNDKENKPTFNVEIKPHVDANSITCVLNVTLDLVNKGNVLATTKTSMIGMFKSIGEPQLSKEDFASINAPAIIYPFIREHISNLSIKGGLGQFLIPPLNFTKKKQAAQTKV